MAKPAAQGPGRRPRPRRCVIQVKQRGDGVVYCNSYSVTVDCDLGTAIRRVQDAFADVADKYRRATDDPRWAQ